MSRQPPRRSRAGRYLSGEQDLRSLRRGLPSDERSPSGLLADVRAAGRLVRAWVRGDYRDVRLRSVLAVVTAVAYFVFPLDLIPDVFLGLGFTDDAVVVALMFQVVRQELDGFRRWEGR
jgi:uncharacterized membrane protein YkvA (DUF1232 family)